MAITKSRFFLPKTKKEEDLKLQPSSPPSSKEDSLFVNSDEEEQQREENTDAHQEEAILSQPRETTISLNKFAKDLKAVVGDILPVILEYLYNKYSTEKQSVKAAISELFTNPPDIDELQHMKKDSTTTTRLSQSPSPLSTAAQSPALGNDAPAKRKMDALEELEKSNKRMQMASSFKKGEIEQQSWMKSLGTIEVQAWATRPTIKPLKFSDLLTVKRLIPRNSSMQKSSIIRLCLNEREIGRLPEDLTRIFSPLIDLNIAHFNVTVMENMKRRLSTGDSFLVSIEVLLKNSAFVKNINALEQTPVKKGTGFSFATESEGEAAMRLRQFAVANLFDRLKLRPLKLDSEGKTEDDQAASQVAETEAGAAADAKAEADAEADADADSEVEEPVDKVNLDQLRQFYQANNQSKLLESLPETTEPPEENFKLQLRDYQKHGLSWMLAREKELDVLDTLSGDDDKLSAESRKNIDETGMVNPLWRKYKWPGAAVVSSQKIELTQLSPSSTQNQADNGCKFFYANLYNGELSLEKPVIRTSVKGGILADEMGLGKTIATLALVNSVPYDTSEANCKANCRYASKTTLIIVPMSLLSQWKEEFEKANNNTANHVCHLYYGDETSLDLSRKLCNLDASLNNNNNNNKKIPIVVITTYGTVLNEFTRLSKQRNFQGELPKIGLYSVKFFRIILDEGHNIRNRSTKTAKSVYELQSSRKWVLTGTPIVNRLDDLYSLVKFLELDPWNNFSYWKTFVTMPFEQKKISQTLDVIKSILEPIFLRRTKNQKKNGKPLVQLPEKQVVIEEIKFNEQEAKLYQWFKMKAYESFAEGVKSGQLLRQYTQILTHILRLRQVCCHVDLIGGAHEMDDEVIDLESDEQMKKFLLELKEQQAKFLNDTEVKETIYKLYEHVKEENECSICTTSPIPRNELALTPCGHTFCISCILEHLDFQSELRKQKLCPNCREPISKYKLFKLRQQKTTSNEIRFHTQQRDHKQDYPFQIYLYDPNRSSSKIQALTRHLKQLQQQAANSKVIVFSQFASYLDIIEAELKLTSDNHFNVYKFDGRLNMNERSKLLNAFNEPVTNGKISVLLLSLKAGGVGLNLTTASRAFMMDPWWSPSIEDQAIDRIHRIGQNETVKVVRFIMENSIETKMLKIQERKKQIGEAVGVEEEERRKRRIEEIQILFEE
ncbi:uncharacterized protein LODBEIA_P45230 [Lodderomyces beijingensis]|uniref:DNA repair protein RAD5 n=1 Tax=Lodderomyces beijingensis TaxID=1775926 RepID=A0ABP0ZQ88_9ASCO